MDFTFARDFLSEESPVYVSTIGNIGYVVSGCSQNLLRWAIWGNKRQARKSPALIAINCHRYQAIGKRNLITMLRELNPLIKRHGFVAQIPVANRWHML